MATEWDGAELIELCKQKRNRDISPYWESLNWNDRLASFFADQSKKVWDDLAGKLGQRSLVKVFPCNAYAVACIYSLNPMADMLSQIISMAVLEGPHEEHKVRPDKISGKLEGAGANSVKEAWDKFYGSDEFGYVNAICNKIKHHRSIRPNLMRLFDIESPEGVPDNVFESFEYRGKLYPETTSRTIVYQYRQNVRGLIINTGVSINDYLKGL